MIKKPVTDEMLHAFIDNELDQPEHDYVLTILASDSKLADKVNELRYFKQLVRAARPNVEFNSKKALIKPRTFCLHSWPAAAALLICTVLITVLSLSYKPGGREYTDRGMKHINQELGPYENINAVAHLNGRNDTMTSQLLSQVRFLASQQQQLGKPINIDVIADGDGIKQLLREKNIYRDQIEAILNTHPNVRFFACLKTLENKNIDLQGLLPGIQFTKIGKAALSIRKKQGWISLNV